jgi:hypothetical protein
VLFTPLRFLLLLLPLCGSHLGRGIVKPTALPRPSAIKRIMGWLQSNGSLPDRDIGRRCAIVRYRGLAIGFRLRHGCADGFCRLGLRGADRSGGTPGSAPPKGDVRAPVCLNLLLCETGMLLWKELRGYPAAVRETERSSRNGKKTKLYRPSSHRSASRSAGHDRSLKQPATDQV